MGLLRHEPRVAWRRAGRGQLILRAGRRWLLPVILTAVAIVGLAAVMSQQPASAAAPVASGRVVVARTDTADSDLVVIEPGTGAEAPLVADTGSEHSPVWSPDGTKIAFVREVELDTDEFQADIWVVDADGSNETQLTYEQADDSHPTWSADSSSVFYDSDSAELRQIYRVELSSPETVEQLTTSSTHENYSPTVSPDGTKLVFARKAVGTSDAQLYSYTFATTTLAPLTSALGDHDDPEYSRDGTAIAFSSNRGNVSPTNYDLYVMAANGTAQTAVATAAASERSPRWLPNTGTSGGPRLAYVTPGPGNDGDLRTIRVDGLTDAGLITSSDDDSSGDVEPLPGCSIAWDGGAGDASWHDADNWDLDRVPAHSDDVCIPDLQAPTTHVEHTGGTTEVLSITTSEQFLLSGGTLDVNNVAVRGAGVVDLDAGSLSGDVSLDGGPFTLDSAAELGAGTTTLDADATLTLVSDDAYVLPAGAELVNEGTLRLLFADSISPEDGETAQVVNAGGATITKTGNDETVFDVSLSNSGTLDVSAGGVTLATTDPWDNGGDLLVRGAGALATGGPLTNAGTVTISDGGSVQSETYGQTTAPALTELTDAEATLAADALTFADGELRGSGTVTGAVTNSGASFAPGTLAIDGTFTQSGDGVLNVEISSGENDTLIVSDETTLGGTLALDVAPDTVIEWDDELVLVEAPALTEAFTLTGLPDAPDGISYDVTYAGAVLALRGADVELPSAATTITPSRPISTWSNVTTVTVTPDGGTDDVSGVAGYEITWLDANDQPVATGTTAQLPDGSFTASIRTRDEAGNLSAGELMAGPFLVDRSAPTNVALTTPAGPIAYSLLVTAGVPRIKLTWPAATDTGSGIAGYALTVTTRTPQATAWPEPAVAATLGAGARTRTFAAKAGATSCFRLVARDAAGNSTTSAQRCVAVPLDDGALTPAKAAQWTSSKAPRFYLGSAATSTQAGASLTRGNLKAKRIALVATTCPACGSVRVLWNGKEVGNGISLQSSLTVHRVVIPVTTFSGVRTGRVTVSVVTGPVHIDGVAVAAR